jgi:hypothetical protein
VLAHVELAWRLRDQPDPLPPQQLVARVNALAHDHLRSLFRL